MVKQILYQVTILSKKENRLAIRDSIDRQKYVNNAIVIGNGSKAIENAVSIGNDTTTRQIKYVKERR